MSTGPTRLSAAGSPARSPEPAKCGSWPTSSAADGAPGAMASRGPIRIVVGEDQPIVREGIVHVLEAAGFEVVGVASDAVELVRQADKQRPDVVVTDIQMPPTSTD